MKQYLPDLLAINWFVLLKILDNLKLEFKRRNVYYKNKYAVTLKGESNMWVFILHVTNSFPLGVSLSNSKCSFPFPHLLSGSYTPCSCFRTKTKSNSISFINMWDMCKPNFTSLNSSKKLLLSNSKRIQTNKSNWEVYFHLQRWMSREND